MVEPLIATAAAVLGALFAGTVRKVGSDLGSAATTVAANQVAELVRRWLGPDHPVSVALEEAQQRPRDRHPPATLEETLRELAETKPEFVVELRRLLDPPPPPSITFGGPVNQYGPVNVIGQATINAGSIGGPSADAPDVVVGQPPDSAEGSANLVLQGAIVAAGSAEINIIRAKSEPARQLEAVQGFVGREAELRWLRQRLRHRPGPGPVAVILGEPGVGKTDLALMVANQLADQDYPDLQLQVGLTASPEDLDGVLRGILLALGRSPEEIPDGEAQRAGEYRSLLNGKRALVVLDGATSSHQIRTLAPPWGCAAIVTTRTALSGPLERGAEQLQLGRLSRPEAVTLLAGRVGSARVARQPYGAAQLVDACDRLPQALVVTAAFLASPAGRYVKLRRIAADLRRRPLSPGTPLGGLGAAFDLSYQQLPDQQRHTFQLLGLLNSSQVNIGALARAADIADDEAERRLGALANVSLVEGRPGHWRLRPLVLDYARQRADQDLQEPGRSNALQRALAYQLAQVRGQRRKITEAAKVHPATAARLQAELDLKLARGAALVDAAVGRGLDLLELAGENLADVLHEVIRVWPDPDWRRKAVRAIRIVAAREPEAATVDRPEAVARQQRARRWLAKHPEEPPPRPVRHAAGAYPPAPPVPGPEEIRRFREQAELLGALERSGGQRPVPEQVDHRPLDQGTMRVFGTGFWAYETIPYPCRQRLRVDNAGRRLRRLRHQPTLRPRPRSPGAGTHDRPNQRNPR